MPSRVYKDLQSCLRLNRKNTCQLLSFHNTSFSCQHKRANPHNSSRRKLRRSVKPCTRICPKNYDPVCDSTGKTHANYCEFTEQSCLAKVKGQTLTLAHKESCEQCSF